MTTIRTLLIIISSIFIAQGLFAQEPDYPNGSYALGTSLGKNFSMQGVDSLDFEKFMEGLKLAMRGKPGMEMEAANQVTTDFVKALTNMKAQRNLEVGKAFLDAKRKEKGVLALTEVQEGATIETGILYEVLNEGKGEKPTLESKVTTHYHGTLTNGEVFDSSVDRGTPASFPLKGVIKGWQLCLQQMPKGAKWRIYLPADMAYGSRGSGSIGPNEVLVFEVELIEFE